MRGVLAAAILLLYGCSFSSGVPSAPSSGATSPNAKSGDLLYVASGNPDDDVSVLTFPQGQLVTTIKGIGTPYGICSDTRGNIWVAVYDSTARSFYLDEFAHGGTKPIERLKASGFVDGCAVDPASGDLAGVGVPHGANGGIEIWPQALKGRPHIHRIAFEATSTTYDNNGNLFVDGIHGSTFNLYFGELPKGKTFQYITPTKFASWDPGSVQWDGHYVTMGVRDHNRVWLVYRMQISGNVAKVVDVIHLEHLAASPSYWIAGNKIVATQKAYVVRRVGLYDYPAGGQRTLYPGSFKPVGITVSVVPK